MRFHVAVAVALAMVVAWSSQTWAQDSEEGRLIDTLKSGATTQEKDAACRRLKDIGTVRAVPALAACLTDDALAHPARQALQCMPGPEAGAALLDALPRTSGLNRVGLIDSLGIRREVRAVPALIAFLAAGDTTVAPAAARSLGSIGGADVVRPLEEAFLHTTGVIQASAVDGLLRVAEHMRKDGENQKSIAIAKFLLAGHGHSKADGGTLSKHARTAAYDSWILAAPPHRKRSLVLAGIKGEDAAERDAALRVAAEIPGKALTKALSRALRYLRPETQIAVLAALGQRSDASASHAVRELVLRADTEPSVRLAALNALADAGDATCVSALLEVAAGKDDVQRKAARQTLGLLHHGDIRAALYPLLKDAPPLTQIEVIQALVARRDAEAVPALFTLAEKAEGDVQTSAIRALGALAGASDAPRLIKRLLAASTDEQRDATEDALVAVAGRAETREAIVDALLGVDASLPVPVRVAALRGAARIDAVRPLAALRAAAHDANRELCKGAVRVLAHYAGADAIDDLLALAGAAADESENTIALRGYWRLLDTIKDRTAAERLERVRAGMAQARALEGKKAGLGVLAGVPSKEALEFAAQACAEESIRAEAEAAAYQIAARIFIVERPAAERVLRRLAEEAKDERVRTDAAGFKSSLDQYADYAVPWLVSQPYRIEGKNATDLFDTPLGPELPDGGGVVWSNMPAPPEATLFWQVDLSSVVRGDNCIVYLKTQVFWPQDAQVQLDMGSDDGIKVWVNGAQVYANNAIRGFTAAQDKATATLKKGWNAFLVKISQHSAGCAMAMRVHPVDSTTVQPVTVEAR